MAAGADIVATTSEAAGAERPPLVAVDCLETFLDEHGLGEGPVRAERIGDGGGSNFSFLFFERGDERLVLRRPPRPPLPPSAHDMVREARLQLALAPHGIPSPPIVAICEDAERDRRALLRDAVPRRPRGHERPAGGSRGARCAPPARRGARRRARRDPFRGGRDAGLEAFVRPAVTSSDRYAASHSSGRSTRHGGSERSSRSPPARRESPNPFRTVVHGDYRLGN